MEPFRIDFARMRGHELILDREQPITREELDPMELQMLRSSTIPFLLPVEWIEIDGNVSFRYAIEGRRMLSHHLQLHDMTMQDMYACLLAVADALDACRSYLLRPECCLLQDTCLFIGERWDDVYLLYVPIQNPNEEAKQAVEGAEAFTALVMRLAAQVSELDGSGLQLVLKQLQNSRRVRPALRKVLQQLLDSSPGNRFGESVTFEPHIHLPHRQEDYPRALPQFQARPAHAELPVQAGNYDANNSEPVRLNQSEAEAAEKSMDEADHQDESSTKDRSRWAVSAAAAIIMALVWRYGYMDAPSNDRLLICLGTTIIIAAASYIAGWRGSRRPGSVMDSPHSMGRRSHAGSVSQPLQWSLESRLLDRRAASVPVQTERRSASARVLPSIRAGAVDRIHVPIPYSEEEARSSAVIRQSMEESAPLSEATIEATVWIGRDSNGRGEGLEGMAEKVSWQLERTLRGHNERLSLSVADEESFLIGRSGSKVHYADEHPGVSRVHLEFGSSEEGYMVKDLGSRNGTTLNGSPMIAYKQYKLQSEDELQLAGNDGPIYTIRQVQEAASA